MSGHAAAGQQSAWDASSNSTRRQSASYSCPDIRRVSCAAAAVLRISLVADSLHVCRHYRTYHASHALLPLCGSPSRASMRPSSQRSTYSGASRRMLGRWLVSSSHTRPALQHQRTIATRTTYASARRFALVLRGARVIAGHTSRLLPRSSLPSSCAHSFARPRQAVAVRSPAAAQLVVAPSGALPACPGFLAAPGSSTARWADCALAVPPKGALWPHAGARVCSGSYLIGHAGRLAERAAARLGAWASRCIPANSRDELTASRRAVFLLLRRFAVASLSRCAMSVLQLISMRALGTWQPGCCCCVGLSPVMADFCSRA